MGGRGGPDGGPSPNPWVSTAFAASVFASAYTAVWDVKMDWGLMRANAALPGLRRSLQFERPAGAALDALVRRELEEGIDGHAARQHPRQ